MRQADRDEILATVRARSRRAVHLIFVVLAFSTLAIGLAVHHMPDALGLPASDAETVARGFLYMGSAYVATLFAWDWLLSEPSEK